MQQLVRTARNIVIGMGEIEDNQVVAQTLIEAVLTTIDKECEFRGMSLAAIDRVHTYRFMLTLDGARNLVTSVNEWIADAERMRTSLGVEEYIPKD